MPEPSTVDFNAQQHDVINRAPEERLLVNAGAGTGKTRVLVERLSILVEEHGLYPGTELLVLSFSRAVVAEIRKRLGNSDSAMYAGVSTFDSFATKLLADFSPDETWQSLSYDDRIRSALRLVNSNDDCISEIKTTYRHLLVDEIQDLVGIRAEFVARLLTTADAGFTLFGDPAQSIYEHQHADGSGRVCLYQLLPAELGQVVTLTFTQNYRARTEQTKRVLSFGPRLQAPSPDYGSIRRDLETLILTLPSLGNLESILGAWRQTPPTSDAVLCRTNGQALRILDHLRKAEVCCKLKNAATDRVIPSWIALSTMGVDSARISKNAFLERITTVAGESHQSAEEKWSFLRRLCTDRANDIDLRRLGWRLSASSIPQELLDNPGEGVTVSTIHRAKGLEFERVIVTRPDLGDDAVEPEELRVLYVALTRAVSWVGLMDAPKSTTIGKSARWNRWFEYGYAGKRRYVTGVEVRPSDTCRSIPPGAENSVAGDSLVELQQYINQRVRPGDSVVLRPIVQRGETSWCIEHEGCRVGEISPECAACLSHACGSRRPAFVDNLYVDATETVVGSPDASRTYGLGHSGFWQCVRVVGFGRLGFLKDE